MVVEIPSCISLEQIVFIIFSKVCKVSQIGIPVAVYQFH